MSPFLAEFIGTMLLILMGNGVVGGTILKGTKSEGAGWLTIVVGWGLGVVLAIYAVGNVSGAHLNPAVTLSLAIAGNFDWAIVPVYIVAQLAGAFAGAVVVWLHYYKQWGLTPDAEIKRAVFCTAPAVRSPLHNFISEALATMVLVLGIFFLGANTYTEGLKPLVIGLLVIAIGLSLGGTTGFAINPARDLGPRIAHALLPIDGKGSSDWSYAWIPVVGPLVGAIAGALLYQLLF